MRAKTNLMMRTGRRNVQRIDGPRAVGGSEKAGVRQSGSERREGVFRNWADATMPVPALTHPGNYKFQTEGG